MLKETLTSRGFQETEPGDVLEGREEAIHYVVCKFIHQIASEDMIALILHLQYFVL